MPTDKSKGPDLAAPVSQIEPHAARSANAGSAPAATSNAQMSSNEKAAFHGPLAPRTTRRRKTRPALETRHRAALQCLLSGPVPVTRMAKAARVENGEELIQELRDQGFDIPTVNVRLPPRDNQIVDVAVCHLSERDMKRIIRFIRKMKTGQG